MLKRTAILTTCLFLIVALVNAQETASDEHPTSKVILTELESKTEALARSYREKIEALDGAYIERLTSLREDAAARLLALQKEIASSDLDEAVRLRDLAAEILEQASTPPLQNSARSRLASENESLKEELTRLKEDLNLLRAAKHIHRGLAG